MLDGVWSQQSLIFLNTATQRQVNKTEVWN